MKSRKRFYLDLDKDKLKELIRKGECIITFPHSFSFSVKYSWNIENEDFSMIKKE